MGEGGKADAGKAAADEAGAGKYATRRAPGSAAKH